MRVHFVFTGGEFSYAYYIGVMTAVRAQGWPVVLWMAADPEPASRYFELVRERVEVVRIDVAQSWPALQGVVGRSRRVALFDYLIWKLAADEGGAVMGLDSVTLRGMADLLPADREMVVPRDDENDEASFSSHGVIVRAGSALAREIHRRSAAALQGAAENFTWGSAGIIPFLEVVRENLDLVEVVDYGLLGGYNHDGRQFYLFREDGELLHPEARTIALYATADAEDFGRISERYVRHSNSLYARLVRQVLPEEEWRPPRRVHQFTHKHRPFRFHLLGLAHLPTRAEISTCAYTQKVIKLAWMLRSLEHEVIFYGTEGSEVLFCENVTVLSEQVRRATYGDYDWNREFFRHSGTDLAQRTFNENAVEEINKRKRPGDFLLCTMGNYQKPIADGVGEGMFVVEPGIGYEGVFARFRAFESYAWMHYLYGRMGMVNGDWYDAVIPNYFARMDFPYRWKKENYALYIGRVVKRKGVDVAVEVTRELGMGLVIAGQGSLHNSAEQLAIDDPHVSFVGAVGPEVRGELMSRARVVIAPTYYIEPFGGVAVEAQLCGTPVVTTDWGAFSETVQHGVTGYRCRTFEQFLWAVRNIGEIDPADCRRWAVENYSLERVRWMFQEWFEQIADLAGEGWYERRPERVELDWLMRKGVGNKVGPIRGVLGRNA